MGCAARNRRRGSWSLAGAAALCALVALVPPPARAALLGSCAIVVIAPGKMVPDGAIATLGSAQPGGAAALARVTANSLICVVLGLLDCFRVSTPAPSGFTAYPSGGDAGVTFSTSYRIDGGSGIGGGVQTEVLNGTHTVAVDLAAVRASGVFPAGSYRAQVTVLCE